MLMPMTKVQLTFKLARILNDADLKQIARLHAVYGLFAARLAATGDELFIEYDSSRLMAKEVRGVLEAHGLPLAS
jgi:hypothetical protein